MADVKLSAFTVTSDSNGIVPIFITPGANNAINLRDAILAIASGGLVYKGLFDASTETDFPSGTEGDMYVVNNTGANPSVVNGISLSTGDQIIANTTGGVGVPANWDVIPVITSPDATETIKGITRYATTVETEARAITDKAVVPSALANFVLNSELINQEAQLVTYRVQMIFDDSGNDLPAVDTTTIDGQTVVTGDLVYVKDSSVGGKIDSVYSAVVTTGNIVWTYEYTVGTNAVYAEDGTVYGDTVLMDSNVTYFFEDLVATNVVADDITTENLTVNNLITADNYNQNYDVRLIFDDENNALPLADSTQIDGVTVVTGDLVYVKNSSDAGQVGKIYTADVNTGVITWTLLVAPKDGDTIYSSEGTIYGDTINDYSEDTVTNIENLATENIITNNYNLNYNTRLIFDDATSDLPLADSTQIDGVTVVDGDLVYVKEALDNNTEGKVYQASVTGGVITWTLVYTLKDGETITVSEGDVYGETINTQGDTFVTNITNLATENIITENYNLAYNVDLVFDDGANDLPATTGTTIDGQTLANDTTYLVYVKDALTASLEQKIHEGVVDGSGNITWTELYALQIGDTYYSSIGDVFGDTVNNFSDTTVINGTGVGVGKEVLDDSYEPKFLPFASLITSAYSDLFDTIFYHTSDNTTRYNLSGVVPEVSGNRQHYDRGTGNTYAPIVHEGHVYLPRYDGTATRRITVADLTNDLSLPGSWTDMTISGITLTNQMVTITGIDSDGYMCIKDTTLLNLYRFSISGTTLTYVDTLILPVADSSMVTNSNGHYIYDANVVTKYSSAMVAGITFYTGVAIGKFGTKTSVYKKSASGESFIRFD